MSTHGGSADDRPITWTVDRPRRGGKESSAARVRLQVLSREDIERRIEQLTNQVAGEFGVKSEGPAGSFPSSAPRWISPKDLIARVRPFLVYN